MVLSQRSQDKSRSDVIAMRCCIGYLMLGSTCIAHYSWSLLPSSHLRTEIQGLLAALQSLDIWRRGGSFLHSLKLWFVETISENLHNCTRQCL